MTHDLASGLDAELDASSPPTAITPQALIHRGRRRRAVRTGGLATGLAAVVAGAVFLTGAIGGGGTVPSGTATDAAALSGKDRPIPDQPAVTLPELEPGALYAWGKAGPPTDTAEGAQLSAALLAFLTSHDVPNMRLNPPDPANREPSGDADGLTVDLSQKVPMTPENYPGMKRYDDALDKWTEYDPGALTATDIGYSQPVYAWGDGASLYVGDDDGGTYEQSFDVKLTPKGGYVPGTAVHKGMLPTLGAAPYLTTGCEDYTFDGQFDGTKVRYDCKDLTTPSGEQALLVDETVGADHTSMRFRTLVVYRADGTALTVTLGIVLRAALGDRPADYLDTKAFQFTGDDLVALAEALPYVTVA